MSIKICKWKTTNMKEAVTGIFDYFSSVKTKVSFTVSSLGSLCIPFSYLFICCSVFCGRKRMNITHSVRLSIWVSNESSQRSKKEMPWNLKLGGPRLMKYRYRFKIIGKISMAFHRDLLNLCHSCNCTNSLGEGVWTSTVDKQVLGWSWGRIVKHPSPQQVSFTWLHNGWTPEGNGSNNCTGNYSIKRSTQPPASPGILSLLVLFTVLNAVSGGGCRVAGSESSLGWVCHDPVIWLDVQPLSWGEAEWSLTVFLTEHNTAGKVSQKQPNLTVNHAGSVWPGKLLWEQWKAEGQNRIGLIIDTCRLTNAVRARFPWSAN